MGEQSVSQDMSDEDLRSFTSALLEDVHALQKMLDDNLIETGVRRIGVEQEMFIVDKFYRPAPLAVELLERMKHPQFTTELGRFNLECNSNPYVYDANCLSKLEKELRRMYRTAMKAAEEVGAKVALTGILPTLEKTDLGLDNMVPMPRYYALNRAMIKMSGGEFKTHIKGLDELNMSHDNVMLEACNTSFQIHFQVAPAEFARLYNVSQAVTGPVLAAAVNSPTLLGHRLWHETRIALFQQSVDHRTAVHHNRGMPPRVHFGDAWVNDSVIELFRQDIARFRIVLATQVDKPPLEVLEAGGVPKLSALCLHNGTVYRWNRPCYGITDGVPHLRIENRVLPSGPTIVDEMANAAFYFGLMSGMLEAEGPIDKVMDFDAAKGNFLSAARRGLNAEFEWINGKQIPARELITEHLVPLARYGLETTGINKTDIERYLGIIEERVRRGRTGSVWSLQSLASMAKEGGTRDERMRTLTAVMIKRQRRGRAVHSWKLASLGEGSDWRSSFVNVSQFMDTDLFTVRAQDIVDLAATLMEWENVKYIPVEDNAGRLIGLVTHHDLLHLISRRFASKTVGTVTVEQIMVKKPITVTPETTTLKAIRLMRDNNIGCLPVIRDGRLAGIVTERHFLEVAARLMERLKH
jgi:CBS domain-containing protein